MTRRTAPRTAWLGAAAILIVVAALVALGAVLPASRVGTLDPQLAPGERLLLRRRA